MIMSILRVTGRIVLWMIAAIVCSIILVLIAGTAGWLRQFNDSVTLPNGMVLKREFDFTWIDRNDMFAADGRTQLARAIEFVCFNDRFVLVYAYEREQSGLFDAETGGKVPGKEYDTAFAASGLDPDRRTCGGGYFAGMLGPGLLYDGMKFPFLPPCSWRNTENRTLARRDWFERPCDDQIDARFPTIPGDAPAESPAVNAP